MIIYLFSYLFRVFLTLIAFVQISIVENFGHREMSHAILQRVTSLKSELDSGNGKNYTFISKFMSRKDSNVSELCLQFEQETRDRSQPPKTRCGIVVVSSYLSTLKL